MGQPGREPLVGGEGDIDLAHDLSDFNPHGGVWAGILKKSVFSSGSRYAKLKKGNPIFII